MTRFRNVLVTALAAAAFVIPSQAATVTWDFAGTHSTTNFGAHGTTFTGSVSFNTVTSQATAFAFTISGYPGDVTFSMIGTGFVDVRNEEGFDFISFRVPVSMSTPVGPPWQTAIFTLDDRTGTMLSSAVIPTSVPSLATYATLALDYDQGYRYDRYALTSLTEAASGTPEPASMGLIALGLAGVVTAVRKRYTTR